MSAGSLQDFILLSRTGSNLDAVTASAVLLELDNIDRASIKYSSKDIDWHALLLAGSILARSDNRRHLEAALRIATAAVTLGVDQKIRDGGSVLLDKLHNFKASNLAAHRRLVASDLNSNLGVSLKIELQRREFEDSVLIESSGKWIQVNEFQKRFWEGAKEAWVSASAPTASGKTFIVMQWLIDQIISTEAAVAIYLAPTRALVSEIEDALRTGWDLSDQIKISSLPVADEYHQARLKNTKIIYVLTQERLHLLANMVRSSMMVDLLVVDEAQKIGDNQRGVVLQDGIERLVRANSKIKVLFVSPSTENPEELLSDAPVTVPSKVVDADVPTVLQNIILVEQAPRKPKIWNLRLVRDDRDLELGTVTLHSAPSGVKKKLAFIAAALGERGGTLIYANTASEAEDIALLVSQLCADSQPLDPELKELAELARSGVHQSYRLADFVKQGVAFHYGNMPSLIRQEVERLFKVGKLKFLVCTSTLIEGVNLSCRTIVLRGPRKGKGKPMSPHDFWNLAGRAGRWGNEFQGNIVCIDASDKSVWPTGVPKRARYPIKRESDFIIEKGQYLIAYLGARASVPLEELEVSDRYEQVGAYLLSAYLRNGTIMSLPLAKRHSPDLLEAIEWQLSSLSESISLDSEMISRHPGVSAFGMQSLLDYFDNYKGGVENLLPVSVQSNDGYDRFITIMRRINANLYPVFTPDSAIPLFAVIITQWLSGYSLASMIQASINYHVRNNKEYKLPVLIRSTMDLVEQIARFKAPKYLSAYIDVLSFYLRKIGREDLLEDGLDLGVQLEYGVSSRTLLSLMELGISRMSAVSVYELISFDDLDKAGCLEWLRAWLPQLESSGMPMAIVREIKSKI
ncbi:DEAD/DEAH box helicase [uncultured Pseudomonas sp.]|uniref:DEAD/DEAH box helicase n=1 Tax=uncultured Pseudomonas sp. TaxID=114707 RepID=UPI002587010B|nr:DEAD/DEAH box helicase [uncultured Pseudomonas sp.]